ncbi:3' terminal RNA ribose 2'-O-methyltransferase Hen1 [Nocardia puris]|uniref:Small RNA 2'-O-methyltransferase n=1 Tax=Nocardia puris TaxID=208602 RepID=A0A366DEI7_9NOCA|nr:3' terminal RNA ribose 2'-O-methyltransferase Hen1 [Nocardia puris]MBF6211982.1 3' terminal RNA ribose 2'-O-methyltransferase Hen1 [Nocardia puris]MBF6367008.1 3' terminal RNA ribose 2'-O-methyltransferase Hen1 [Nocardia puris]MBF6462015.1 3' terminal RNA ribose 2'-O-methyltransferase Hen1 [Nocardia puris]RBO88472.1 3' terminal RNA ribose 2'-O-methyltransferase Hen1 [Nocardia puris]
MLLTITCTRPDGADWPATDLGFLLHKNPARVQSFEQSYGTAHVLYPEAEPQRCSAALVLEVDPIRLVRGRSRGTPDFSLGQYVNDRPYAASSLLSVAIGHVFRTALQGRSKDRPALAETPLPLRVELPAVPCRGGAEAAERVFAPLGWTVEATPIPLDPAFPEWGDSHYLRLSLTGTVRVGEALSHLYVLLPVLDGAKHYWMAADEVDKLIRAGSGWLAEHPERGWITRRYLARRESLVRTALARLAEVDEADPDELGAVEDLGAEGDEMGVEAEVRVDATGAADASSIVKSANTAGATDATTAAGPPDTATTAGSVTTADAADATTTATTDVHGTPTDAAETAERKPSLAVLRRAAVLAALHETGARRVLDLGCGEGALLRQLMADRTFGEIVGVDVSLRALHIAKRRLKLDRLPERAARRLTLIQGSLTYTDARLRGYDAAVLMEVIEHVDPPRLGALEHAVFGAAAPGSVIVTTPNAEHNVLYDSLPAGEYRHDDHRFEWTRAEFADWAGGVAQRHGYRVEVRPVGPEHPDHGAATQLALFTRNTTADEKGAA